MTAMELLVELQGRGAIIEANGDGLRIDAPKGAVTPELREALTEHKAEVLALITIPEDEIGWRVEAMLPQIPAIGTIPFLAAKPGCESQTGHCLSCGEPSSSVNANRCAPCCRAANLALEVAMTDRHRALKD